MGSNTNSIANANRRTVTDAFANPNRRTFRLDKSKAKTPNKQMLLIVAIIVLLIIAIITIAFRTLGSGNANTQFSKRYSSYDSGWTVTIDGASQDVKLPYKVATGEDDLIVFSNILPQSIPEYTAIDMRNFHQVMEVRVDGELIYTYPNFSAGSFTILSDAWSIINLAPNQAGKPIEITLKNITIRGFSGYITDIYIGDSNSILQHLREESTLPFLTGIVMMILGIFLVGVSLMYGRYTNQKPNTQMGLAMFFFGAWLTNRSKIPYFSSSNGRVFFLSIGALLLVPIFLFLYDYYRNEKHKRVAFTGFIISLLFGIFIVSTSSIIKHNAETVALIAYLLCFLAIFHDCIVLYMESFGKASKLRNKSELAMDRIEFASTLLFPLAAIEEVIFFDDRLWTELSMFFRILILMFAATYTGIVFWRIYLVTKERALISERLQESQLELMMGQIQPHFLFNTLSSIRTLVKTDPDTAYSMLYDFSKYLRANVDNVTNLDGIKFSAEVEHIKSYVNIENVRFADRLSVIYDIQVDDFVVPPLSIQPLVENAIKHGVTKKTKGGTVSLKSYETDEYNIVEINDNGVGISYEAAQAIFSVYEENSDKVGMESNQVVIDAMKDTLRSLTLLDANGQKMDLSGPTLRETQDNDSKHKSAGMMNIILRLKELSKAKIEITSQVDVGTNIKVMFPKQS